MKKIATLTLAVGLLALPLAASAKKACAPACPPPCPPPVCAPVCPPNCVKPCCLPNPCAIVGGVVNGVGCVVGGVFNAVGSIFTCNPCY